MKKSFLFSALFLILLSTTSCLYYKYTIQYSYSNNLTPYAPSYQDFIKTLRARGLIISNHKSLLHSFANCDRRQTLAAYINMIEQEILYYLERIDLQRAGLNELEAFILISSQSNHTNPFTYETLSISTLAQIDAELLFQEILGYQAGHPNALVRAYPFSLRQINTWKQKAQLLAPLISYTSFDPEQDCIQY